MEQSKWSVPTEFLNEDECLFDIMCPSWLRAFWGGGGAVEKKGMKYTIYGQGGASISCQRGYTTLHSPLWSYDEVPGD